MSVTRISGTQQVSDCNMELCRYLKQCFLTQFPLQCFVKFSILKVVFVMDGLKLVDGFVSSANCLFNSRPGWFWAVWANSLQQTDRLGQTQLLIIFIISLLNQSAFIHIGRRII